MIYLREKLVKYLKEDKESLFFLLWLIWMSIYYGVRMFLLTPWYDELYTYYYFISKGPIYAAIHWPLPNNHVGYSVLSGFLNFLGNSAISLRGISYLCALCNLILLYVISRKHFAKGFSLLAVFLYSCLNLVNQLAVQGRGYTLAVTCHLVAVLMLHYICLSHKQNDKKKIIYYVIFSLSLTLGLYTLPSSVYWVIPICLIGGFFLLMKKEWVTLKKLFISSIVAAVNTTVLYGIIWLAIGSNLLTKDENSIYYGLGHVRIICSSPLQAAKTGIGYMLATPYIQSVERKGFFARLWDWMYTLLEHFYPKIGLLLLSVLLMGIILLVICGYRSYKAKDNNKFFISAYILIMIITLPCFLIVQCVLPYFRVFSYIGIPVILLICIVIQIIFYKFHLAEHIKAVVPAGLTFIIAIVLLLSKDYNREYGTAEYYAGDAYKKVDVTEMENICVTDCYQQYLLKYYFNIECESTVIEGTDCILLHREMADEVFDGFRWEFYHTYDTIPWDYIKNNMILQYKNEEYELYIKK